MLALIKREISDAAVFFLVTAIFVFILVVTMVYNIRIWKDGGVPSVTVVGVPPVMYGTLGPIFFLLPLVGAVLGYRQMYLDRDKKISSFLATLATTRGQILSAKIITGVLWILLVLLPIAVADAVLLKVFPMVLVPDAGFLVRMFVTIFLCGLSCYCFGLQVGWRSGKVLPALGILLVVPVLISLVAIKGFGMVTMVIFLLFVSASMIRIRQKFMSLSL